MTRTASSINTQLITTDEILRMLDTVATILPSGANPRIQPMLGQIIDMLEDDADVLIQELKSRG